MLKVEIKLPRDNVNDEYVTILDIPFSNSAFIKKDTIIIEYETSKSNIEMASEHDGYIQYHCNVGDEIAPGTLIATIFDEEPKEKLNETDDVVVDKNTAPGAQSITKFSKDAKKLISELNLNEKDFKGYDFVTRQNVLSFIESSANNAKKADVLDVSSSYTKDVLSIDNSNFDIVKISTTKKREINYLKDIQKHSLNSSLFVTIKLNNLTDFVRTNSSKLKNSILPIITFEISRMLLTYREFNAFFKDDCIYYYKDINVGFAIDLDKGLRVITIYNTNDKSYSEIEEEIWQLSNKYLDEKLVSEEISNSTFTISDLSGDGVSFFIPLINSHQSAILGVGQISGKNQESIFGITFDHRVLSGKVVAKFLNELKSRLESYYVKTGEKKLEIKCMKCLIDLNEEQKLNGHGLIKTVDSNGNDNFICTNCLSGW